MTALSETGYMLQAFSVGAIDYLTKPFDHAVLLARVRTHISLRKATRALQEKNAELEREIQERVAIQHALTSTLRQLEHRTAELHRAQAQLLALEKETTEVRMAGGFAHEMRNVLTGAKVLIDQVHTGLSGDGAVSLCLENSCKLKDLYLDVKEHLPPEARTSMVAALREINDNEETIDAIVRDVSEALRRGLASTQSILEYARLGQAHPGTDTVSMQPLVESILKESECDFAAHRISVDVAISPGCALVGKETYFYSILKNIVLNARDALVEKEDCGDRSIAISLIEEPGALVLRVADTGVGIPHDDRSRMFEPFFTTKLQNGTGLGLGVVRKLVSLYRGTIDVESEPGRGATFRISFPRVERPGLGGATDSEPLAPTGRG
jgi:signal transduction histidine kinase